MTDRQAETGAGSARLRREKRLENTLADGGRDADAGVAHLDRNVLRIDRPHRETHLVVLDVTLRDRVSGVDQQVEEHLAEATFGAGNEHAVTTHAHEPRTMAELVLGHVRR